MTLTPVGKQMIEGVRSLRNLLRMLDEVAAGCRVPFTGSAGWDHIGINLDGMKYWVGLYYSAPEKLWFVARSRIDPAAAARLGAGELTEGPEGPGRYRWSRGVELGSEPVRFFSRSSVSQMQWLESFVWECRGMARSIETPDQPPITEETEGA